MLLVPLGYIFSEKIIILQWKIIIVYLVTEDFVKKGFFWGKYSAKKNSAVLERLALLILFVYPQGTFTEKIIKIEQ